MKSIDKLSEMPADVKFLNVLTHSLFGLFILLLILCGFQYAIKNHIKSIDTLIIRGDIVQNDISSISDSISKNIYGNFYNLNLEKTKQIFESTPWINNAVVKRVYPNHVEVTLSEFKSKAIWGAPEDMRLVDEAGKVFEVGVHEDVHESLPQLIGPEGQGKLMLKMYKDVSSALQPLKSTLQKLELNARGSWVATLDSGAIIELGRGNTVNVVDGIHKFSVSVEKMLTKLNKKSLDIQYVDLRHSDGYALRMHGVSTLDSTLPTALLKK